MKKAEQVEPINTLLLEQEIVKWKNQPSEMTQHCLSFIRQEETKWQKQFQTKQENIFVTLILYDTIQEKNPELCGFTAEEFDKEENK